MCFNIGDGDEMRGKIVNTVWIILAFFVGIAGTVCVYKFVPNETVVVNRSEKCVTITETDTIKSSVDKIYDAVFLISATTSSGTSTGSGFAYKKDSKSAYIITNEHVISGAKTVKIVNASGETYDATVLGSDEYADIAVLKTDVSNVSKIAEIGDSSKIEIGDTIFTVGSPLGEQYFGTVTKGIISGKNRMVGSSNSLLEVIQTDAAINEGNSGGPLVNINGEVIGVNSMKIATTNIEGMGFSIPINTVMSYVDRLEKGEKIERPVLGITMSDISNTWQLYRYGIIVNSDVEYGAVVVNVQKNYPASDAGLQKGDIIIELDGTKVDDSAHLRYALYKYNIGDTIKIKYYRNNKILETTVKLDKFICYSTALDMGKNELETFVNKELEAAETDGGLCKLPDPGAAGREDRREKRLGRRGEKSPRQRGQSHPR